MADSSTSISDGQWRISQTGSYLLHSRRTGRPRMSLPIVKSPKLHKNGPKLTAKPHTTRPKVIQTKPSLIKMGPKPSEVTETAYTGSKVAQTS